MSFVSLRLLSYRLSGQIFDFSPAYVKVLGQIVVYHFKKIERDHDILEVLRQESRARRGEWMQAG